LYNTRNLPKKLKSNNVIGSIDAMVAGAEPPSSATTFGFNHHEGTDHLSELKILKFILLREGVLAKHNDLCGSLYTNY